MDSHLRRNDAMPSGRVAPVTAAAPAIARIHCGRPVPALESNVPPRAGPASGAADTRSGLRMSPL